MKALTVSETGGIHVNGYPAASIDALGFEYTYLYYEPEGDNMFKIVQVGDDLVRVDLTDAEQAICSAFCDSYEPAVVEPAASDEPVEAEVAFIRDGAAAVGFKKKSEFVDGDIELTEQQASSYPGDRFSPRPVYVWSASQAKFVPQTYEDARLVGYYRDANIGDQLDVIWKYIAGRVEAGDSVPSEVTDMLSTIASVKANNPKA
jgi:hypothetical protein